MAYAVKDGEYTYDDLDWLRDELGVAHLELDPWGCLIVTPASDEHETAVAVMHAQAIRQLDASGRVSSVAMERGGSSPVGAATSTCPI